MDAGHLFGRGISFPPRVGADGRMVWSEGETNIREAITVILMTEMGERLLRPEFGAGLGTILFEPNTVATRHMIQTQIAAALGRWEPRIAVESVVVVPDPADPEAAIATITYRLIATQRRDQTSMSVRLGS
jgi:uncharacterized protein